MFFMHCVADENCGNLQFSVRCSGVAVQKNLDVGCALWNFRVLPGTVLDLVGKEGPLSSPNRCWVFFDSVLLTPLSFQCQECMTFSLSLKDGEKYPNH